MAERTVTLRIGANIAGLQSQLRLAQNAVQEFSKKSVSYVEKNGAQIDALANSVGVVGAGLTTLAATAVTRFAQFDKAMSGVAATGDDARGSLDALRQAAITAGADTAFSAAEAAGAIEELAKAGVSSADILGGGLTGALSLAAAGEIDVAQAAETAASAMTQFNLEGSDVGHIADLLAAGAGKAQGGVLDMGQALNQAGLIAGQVGLSIEETTGSLAAMASAGLLGSDAGTSLKTALVSLSSPSATAAKEMERLGIAAYDSNGEFIGMEALAGQLQTQLSGLTDEQRNSALATIFGTDALRTANVLYSEGAEGIREWTQAVDDQGFAAETAAARTDNLLGDLERLGGSLDTVFIQSGSGANDALRGLVQGAEDLVDAIGRIPGPVLTLTTLIAGGGGLALLGVAGMGKLAVATVEARNAMMDLGLMSERTSGKIGRVGKAAGALGAVVAAGGAAALAMDALTDASDKTAVGVEQTISALRGVEDQNIDTLFQGLGGDVNSLAEGLALLDGPHIEKFGSWMNTTFAGGQLQDQVKDTAEQFENIGLALAGMVQAGNAEAAAEQFDIIAAAAAEQGISIDEVNRLMPAYAEALAAVENNAPGAAAATGELAPALDAEALAAERSAAATEAYAQALIDTGDPVSVYEEVLARKEEAERATAEKTAAATEDATDSWEDYAKDVSVTTGDLIREWQRQATEARKFEENLAIIGAAGGQALADEMRAKGPEVAGAAAATIAKAGPKQQAAAIAAHAAATGQEISAEMAEGLEAQGWKLQKAVDGTIEAVNPKKDIVVKVAADTGTAYEQANAIVEYINGLNATITVTDRHVSSGLPGSRSGGITRAGGGSVVGPGTATSDSIPAMLSNGEHVLTASDVRKAGGQSAIYRMRADIQSGLLRYASGGAVGQAENAVERARRLSLSARRALVDARRDERRARSESAQRAAERRVARYEELLDQRQQAVEEARARLERVRQEASSLRTDLRRGNVRDSVTGGLSGALGVTDQLRDLAASGDVSRFGSRRLRNVAGAAEGALTSLYRQAERIDDRIESATDRLASWRQIADGVSSSIDGAFSLGEVTGGTNPWSGEEQQATGQQILAASLAYQEKARKLVVKLRALQDAGYGSAILQEVAMQGVEGGVAMADALLQLSPKDRTALQASQERIDFYAGRAGVAATDDQVVAARRALESAEAHAQMIDKNIGRWAEKLGSAMASALGIKARANGGPVTAGHAYLVNENTPNSELFVPSQSGYVLNNRQMSGLSAGPQKVVNVYVTQNYPQQIPYSKAVNNALQHAAEGVV